MAEEHPDLPRAKDHPGDPRNPPQSLLRPEARRAALISYLGPLMGFFVVVTIALVYWSWRGPLTTDERQQGETDSIATSGVETAGGRSADPQFDSTKDELEFRGQADGDEPVGPSLTRIRQIAASKDDGRRVRLASVEVFSVEANGRFRVRQDDYEILVAAPADAKPPQPGERVTISGVVAIDRGAPFVQATAIDR
jgi:hypothetical protein